MPVAWNRFRPPRWDRGPLRLSCWLHALAVSGPRHALTLSYVPAFAVLPGFTDRRGVDWDLINGIELSRRAKLAGFTTQLISARASVITDYLSPALTTERVARSNLRSLFHLVRTHPGVQMLVSWRRHPLDTFKALLQRPADQIDLLR